jgi:hypothetical protein
MTAVLPILEFRFDSIRHEYVANDTGEVLPHVTGMLQKAGLVDDEWFTDEGRVRGTAVHTLTADYDLGALEDVEATMSRYKPYLQAHVTAMQLLKPVILDVEMPMVHPRFRYGTRPDRIVRMMGLRGVIEIKSGPPEKHHRIQTAMQAIVEATRCRIHPEAISRWGLYLKANGKFKLEIHPDKRDYDEAHRIIRMCCHY